MAFFRQGLAIDLGTANTVIFKDDKVILDEPSIIATGRRRSILASALRVVIGIPFHVAEDPLKAVARGSAWC